MRNTTVKEKHVSTITVNCRATGMGASTTTVEESNVKVVKQNFSRSGNHWEEQIIFFSRRESYVIIKDVSNSGKHNCYKIDSYGRKSPASCGECVSPIKKATDRLDW